MEQAVKDLSGAKRWVESCFSETRPRINDCERQYDKFKTEYAKHEASLKGTPVEAEWAAYRKALDERYSDLKANDDAGMLSQQGRSALRWVDNFSKEKKADQAEKYFKDLQKAVATLQEPRFARSSEAAAFLKDVAPQMPTLEASVSNMAISATMENDLYSLMTLVRGGFDRAVGRGAEYGQTSLKEAENDIAKFKTKYGNHPAGVELLKPIEEKMKSVQLAIDGLQAGARAEEAKKKAELDAQKAKVNAELATICESLSPAIRDAIKAKKCTFSVTGKTYQNQPYFTCFDCGSSKGFCIPCRDTCHKQPKWEKHRLEEIRYKRGDSYCDCGCEFPDCISMPGKEELAAAAAAKAAQDATAKAAADKAAADASAARLAEQAKANSARALPTPTAVPKPVAKPATATPASAAPVPVVTSSGSKPAPTEAVADLNRQKRWLENAFNETRIRFNECESNYNKFTKLYEEKHAQLVGTDAEAEWANYFNALKPRFDELHASDEAAMVVQSARGYPRNIENFMKDNNPHNALQYLEKLKEAVATLKTPRFARTKEAAEFLKEIEPQLPKMIDEVENGALRAEMKTFLRNSISYCERGGLERAFQGGRTNDGQRVLEGMKQNVDEFKAKYGTNPTGLQILAPVEAKIDEYWKKIHAMDEGRKQEQEQEAAKAQAELEEFIDVLAPPIRECIRAKKCTFSVTQQNHRKQPYFQCKDCDKAVYCVNCINVCHKQQQYSSHRVEDRVRKEEAYCTCGCSNAACVSMPGREAQAKAALAAVAAASTPIKIAGLTTSAPTDYDPAWIIDLSQDRSPTVDQREKMSSYNGTANRFNERWREFLKLYETLLRNDISRYAIDQQTMRELNSCFGDAENICRIGADFKSCPHPVGAEMQAIGKKLKVLVEDKRYAAQQRSEKAARDHHLGDIFERAKNIYDAGVQNQNGEPGGNFHTEHNTYTMVSVFPKFMEDAEYLTKEAGDQPHETMDKIKPMMIEAVKLHEKACVRDALAALAGDWPRFEQAESIIDCLKKLSPNSTQIAAIRTAAEAAKKQKEERRAKEEAAAEEKNKKVAEEEAKRKAAMREKWLQPYTGGTMKVGGRDWSYGGDGTIMGPNKVKITFDGSEFLCENLSGAGWWNGEGFGWESHYTTYCEYIVKDGRITVGNTAPIDWDWNANQNMMTPKGHGADKFVAAQRTGSIPYPAMLMIVMYNYCQHKSDMLNGYCMCNQRLFDKGNPGFLCNDCHVNRGHLCPVCDSQFVIQRNKATVCGNHSYQKTCVVCKTPYGGWSHPAFVCDNCGQNFKDNCVQRK